MNIYVRHFLNSNFRSSYKFQLIQNNLPTDRPILKTGTGRSTANKFIFKALLAEPT